MDALKNLESQTVHLVGHLEKDRSGIEFVGGGSTWYNKYTKFRFICNRLKLGSKSKCSTQMLFDETPDLTEILQSLRDKPEGDRMYYNGKVQFQFSEMENGEKQFHECILCIRNAKLAILLDERRKLNLMHATGRNQHAQDVSAAILIKPAQKLKSTCNRVFLGGHMFQKSALDGSPFHDLYCNMKITLTSSKGEHFYGYQLIDQSNKLPNICKIKPWCLSNRDNLYELGFFSVINEIPKFLRAFGYNVEDVPNCLLPPRQRKNEETDANEPTASTRVKYRFRLGERSTEIPMHSRVEKYYWRPLANIQERTRREIVDNRQNVRNSQYVFTKSNLPKPSIQFHNIMELNIYAVISFQRMERAKTKKQLLTICSVNLDKPDQYIRDLSIIQWLMYTEIMKLNDDDMQLAIQRGHGRSIRKLMDFFEFMYQQIDNIVKSKKAISVDVNPKYSVNNYVFDKNGVRKSVKSHSFTVINFRKTQETFACMFLFIAMLFGFATGHNMSSRDLYYKLKQFLLELKYNEEYLLYLNEVIGMVGIHPCSTNNPIEKKPITTAWGSFTIEETMINRGNKIHITDFSAARPVPLVTVKAETCSINIVPSVVWVLILEHHAIAVNVVQYIIERGYDDVIVFETGGSGSHNVKFTLSSIWRKHPKLFNLLWSDFDGGGSTEFEGFAYGSIENPVLNEYLATPSIVHVGLRSINLYDLNVNTQLLTNTTRTRAISNIKLFRKCDHPDKLHLANDLQMMVDGNEKASLSNVSAEYIVEHSRAMVLDALEQHIDLSLVPSDDGYEDKIKFIDFREGSAFAQHFGYDLEEFTVLPNEIINAFSKIVDENGKFHPFPLRRITLENIRECEDSADLQFCQLTNGQYVLFWLNDDTIYIFDPIKNKMSENTKLG